MKGHAQPPTLLQTDNAMAEAVTNWKVQPKLTKAMDMQLHWLRDRECQQQFRIYWRPGKLNCADYWTKHHSGTHHQNMWKQVLTPNKVIEMLLIKNTLAAKAAWTTYQSTLGKGVMIQLALTYPSRPSLARAPQVARSPMTAKRTIFHEQKCTSPFSHSAKVYYSIFMQSKSGKVHFHIGVAL